MTDNQQLSYWRNILATDEDAIARQTAANVILAILEKRRSQYAS